jgi:hypothetical protein
MGGFMIAQIIEITFEYNFDVITQRLDATGTL